MTTSTLITDYVGRGTHASRPVTPNIPAGATALYYETDTTSVFLWTGAAWVAVGASPTIGSGDLLGNATAGSAAAADTTLTALIDRALGSTQGQILYRNATVWTPLAPGTAGQVLVTGGAAANPSWGTGTGSGLWNQVMTTAPTQASTGLTTTLNAGTHAPVDDTTGIRIRGGGYTGITGIIKATPTLPYTVRMLISPHTTFSGFSLCGAGFYDGASTTKLEIVDVVYQNTTNGIWGIEIAQWNSPTSFANTGDFPTKSVCQNPVWIEISEDSANAYLNYSPTGDADSFINLHTLIKSSSWLGTGNYKNIGFFVNDTAQAGTLLQWIQTNTASPGT